MLKEILMGSPPSEVFKKILSEDPTIDNYRLASMLRKEFPALSGDASPLVWHWKSPKESQGLSDQNMNVLLLRLFSEAGYLS